MIFPFRSLMHKLFSQAPLTLYPKQERAWKYLSWTSQPSWNIEEHCLLHPKSCKTVLEQDKLTTVWASDAWAAVPSLTLHRLPRGKPFQLAWNEVVKCRERDWSSVLSIHVWSFLKFLYAEVNALVETYKLNALRWSGFDSVDSVGHKSPNSDDQTPYTSYTWRQAKKQLLQWPFGILRAWQLRKFNKQTTVTLNTFKLKLYVWVGFLSNPVWNCLGALQNPHSTIVIERDLCKTHPEFSPYKL